MKIKLLDESPLRDDIYLKKMITPDGKEVKFSFKNSKSFIIIKNNLVEYLEKHRLEFLDVWKDDNSVKIKPFASFKLVKLTKDTYTGHMYSTYQINIDFDDLKNHLYFVDLNWCKFYRLQFNANNTWINKSNIYKFFYLVIGAILGVIGTIITQLSLFTC